MTTQYCSECGTPINPGTAYCTGCGKYQGAKESPGLKGKTPGTKQSAESMDPGILPKDILEAPLPPGQLTTGIQRRFPVHLILIFVMFLGGLGCFLYGWIATVRVGGPYSFRQIQNGSILSTTRELIRFDDKGEKQWVYSTRASFIEGMLNFDVDESGNTFLSNTHSGQIDVISPKGRLVRSFGDGLDSEFWLCVLQSGNIAVVDTDHDRVQIYDPKGRKLRETGDTGLEEGQFRFPSGITQLPDGSILVADTDNLRIQLFDEDLKHKGNWTFARQEAERKGGNQPLTIKKDTDQTAKMVNFFPTSIFADWKNKKVYVAFESIYKSGRRSGHIAVLDFQGKFVTHRRPRTSDNQLFDSFRMSHANNGMVGIADPVNGYVGVWDPRGDVVSPMQGRGVKEVIAINAARHRQARMLFWTGIGMFVLSLLLLAVLGIMGGRILNKETGEKNKTSVELQNFCKKYLPQAAARVDPESRLAIAKPSFAEMILWCLSFAVFAILLAGSYIMFNYTISTAMFHTLMLILLPVMIIVFTPVILTMRAYVNRGGMLKTNLKCRNGQLYKCLDAIERSLEPDEKLIDALAYSDCGMAYGLLLLTDRRLRHFPPQKSPAKWFMPKFPSCNMQLNENMPLSHISHAEISQTFTAPYNNLTIQTTTGGCHVAPVGCPVLTRAFIQRMNYVKRIVHQ